MISTNEGYTRLEYFSEDVAADKNRKEFDIKNHTLCYTNQRPDFLFIGDSITEYWELNAYFRNSDQLIINRGIAGDTTKYLKKRFYVDAVQLKPKYCILGIGINDSIEKVQYRNDLPGQEENLDAICEKVRRRYEV